MLEKLWNDVGLIYGGLDFSVWSLIDGLFIVSKDNYYLLYYRPVGNSPIRIKIEKNVDLVNMWSDFKEVDVIHYDIYVDIDGDVQLKQNDGIELTYKIITPFLREVKLKEIGI